MIPHQSYLRVCLSCWRRMPSLARLPAQWRTDGHPASMVTCSNACGVRWSQSIQGRLYGTYSKTKEEFSLEDNPYFLKYKKKLEDLKRFDMIY